MPRKPKMLQPVTAGKGLRARNLKKVQGAKAENASGRDSRERTQGTKPEKRIKPRRLKMLQAVTAGKYDSDRERRSR